MELIINKKREVFKETITLPEILEMRENPRASVWVNGVQLKREEYPSFSLNDGDNIKILRLVGGG